MSELNEERLTDAELAEWRARLGIPPSFKERDPEDRYNWLPGFKGTTLYDPSTDSDFKVGGGDTRWINMEYVLCNGQVALSFYDCIGPLAGDITRFFDTLNELYEELVSLIIAGLSARKAGES